MSPALPTLLRTAAISLLAFGAATDVTLEYQRSLSNSDTLTLTGGGITVTFSKLPDGTMPYLDGSGSPRNDCTECQNTMTFRNSEIRINDRSNSECAWKITASVPISQFSLTALSGFDRWSGSNQPKDFFCPSVPGHWTDITGDLASYDASTGIARDNAGVPASDTLSKNADSAK